MLSGGMTLQWRYRVKLHVKSAFDTGSLKVESDTVRLQPLVRETSQFNPNVTSVSSPDI